MKRIDETTVEVCVLKYGTSPFSLNIYTAENTATALLDYLEQIAGGTAYGELNISAPPDGIAYDEYLTRHNAVDPANVCVKINRAWTEDDGIYACVSADGPKASDFINLLDNDTPLRFAMRSMTSGGDNDVFKVEKVIAFDVSTNMQPCECPRPPETI